MVDPERQDVTSVQLVGGVVYANLFEYVLHRWYLHRDGGDPAHTQHHKEPEIPTALVKWDIWAMFAGHALVLALAGWWTALVTIAVYLVILELAHSWQHKLNRGYHLLHHKRPAKNASRSLFGCASFSPSK